MACTLVQSTDIGASVVYSKSNHTSKQRGGSGVANVRMLCNSSVQMRGGLRMSAPSSLIGGGGGFNAVDKFKSKVGLPRGRGSQCAARAVPFFDKFAGERFFTPKDIFTDEGFETIKFAQKEAKRMGHTYVGTEQILLGLIAQGSGIAAGVLIKSMGISLNDARAEVEKIIGKGNVPHVPVEERPIFLPVLEHTPHVLLHTIHASREHGRNYIRPEHWLLGLLRDEECVAVRVLKNLGADPNKIRTQVIQMIGDQRTEAA